MDRFFKDIALRVPSHRFANWAEFISEAPEYSIGLEVVDDTRVRFALGECAALEEGDDFTWFAYLGDGADREALHAVAITGQWASSVPVGAAGEPVGDVILWSDTRARALVEPFIVEREGLRRRIHRHFTETIPICQRLDDDACKGTFECNPTTLRCERAPAPTCKVPEVFPRTSCIALVAAPLPIP